MDFDRCVADRRQRAWAKSAASWRRAVWIAGGLRVTNMGGYSVKDFTVELPGELLELLGSEEEARREAKIAVVLDLVRRGLISRAKAAEVLGLTLWDLPELLAQYRIPWFDYSPDQVERDLEALHAAGYPDP
jgi:predicted HTH domain antitoxin